MLQLLFFNIPVSNIVASGRKWNLEDDDDDDEEEREKKKEPEAKEDKEEKETEEKEEMEVEDENEIKEEVKEEDEDEIDPLDAFMAVKPCDPAYDLRLSLLNMLLCNLYYISGSSRRSPQSE